MSDHTTSDRKLRIAIVGYERLRSTYGRCLVESADVEIVTVLCADQIKARDWKRELKSHSLCNSFDMILADPYVEALLISDAEYSHSNWITRAIAAGKHVLATNPTALSLEAFVRNAVEARANGTVLMDAMPWRFDPALESIIQQLMSGAVGSATQATIHAGFELDSHNGDIASFVRCVTPSLDLAQSLFGRPDSVSADLDISAEGVGTVIVTHPAINVVHCLTAGLGDISCRIDGSQGILTWHLSSHLSERSRKTGITLKRNGKPSRDIPGGQHASSESPFARTLAHFAARCLESRKCRENLDQDSCTLETALAGILASREGVRVSLPLTHSPNLTLVDRGVCKSDLPAIVSR
jgi:predicted dehydrogenase